MCIYKVYGVINPLWLENRIHEKRSGVVYFFLTLRRMENWKHSHEKQGLITLLTQNKVPDYLTQ